MKAGEKNFANPITGAASAAGLGNPKYAPKSLKKKNQAKTAINPHTQADVKNARGEGKKDVNML